MAKAAGLTDRQGNVTSLRNDGTTNPQVTPLYLVLETLNEIDAGLRRLRAGQPERHAAAGRSGGSRARSSSTSSWASTGRTRRRRPSPIRRCRRSCPCVLDTVRAQIAAHCPGPPYGACTWARQQLTENAATTDRRAHVRGGAGPHRGDPRRTTAGRRASSSSSRTWSTRRRATSALAELLASTDDLVQVMRDDTNLVPLYHVLAAAAAPTTKDAQGNDAPRRGRRDDRAAVAHRRARLRQRRGPTEICANELDPDGVLPIALANLVTPMTDSDGNRQRDAARGHPRHHRRREPRSRPARPARCAAARSRATRPTSCPSSSSIRQRGLEQFYAIVRNGTEK